MTREGILEAAARIFGEKGYHGTSMHDIADSVHLRKASLYHHFKSKQEILIALLDQALDLINTNLESVLAQSISPEQKLGLAMNSYLQTITENQNLAAVLLLEIRSLDPELKSLHAARREKFEQLWKDLIIEGNQAGVFNSIDPSLAGRAILGVMNWTVMWYHSDGPRSASEISHLFTDLLLNGLMM